MGNNKRVLTDEEMEKITGGLVVKDNAEGKYWLVRQDGSVIGMVPDKEMAVSFVKAFGASQDLITMDEYTKRFGRNLVW